MILTDVTIRGARPRATLRRLSDGDGLYLLIRPDGARLWRFDYRHAGRRKTLSFGPYPETTLAAARLAHQAAVAQLRDGRDPSFERRRAKTQARQREAGTFRELADEWLDRQAAVVEPSTDARNRVVLRRYVFPVLGRYPVAKIEAPDLLAALQAIERRGRHDTAHRVRQLCGQLFRYAIATGRASRDPSADLRGALVPVRPTHRAALTDPVALGGLLRAIETTAGWSVQAVALRLLPHVFTRPGELRLAEWSEVDLEGAVWRIPLAKMKTRRDAHLVPLSRQALALFQEAKDYDIGSRYCFPSTRLRSRPMSDMTLGAMLARLGYSSQQMTPHGFRAVARTLLDEVLRYPPDVIETQLAHTVRGPLGATYNRSAYLDQRTIMMQAWSDYLDRLRATVR